MLLKYHLILYELYIYKIFKQQLLLTFILKKQIFLVRQTHLYSIQTIQKLNFTSITLANPIKPYSTFHINMVGSLFLCFIIIIIINYHMYSFAQDHVFSCLNLGNYDNFTQKWASQPQEGDQFNQIQNEGEAIIFNQQRNKEIQKLPPTVSSNQDIQQNSESFEPQIFYNPPQKVALLSRNKTFLFKSDTSNSQREACIKGKSYDTQNIGKHLKSITIKHLELLQEANMLHSYEKKALIIFNLSNGSIKDFQILFNIRRLCLRCRKFYSSKDFIRTVLSSPKMDFSSKLMMIKYGERLRSLTYSKLKRWKQ